MERMFPKKSDHVPDRGKPVDLSHLYKLGKDKDESSAAAPISEGDEGESGASTNKKRRIPTDHSTEDDDEEDEKYTGSQKKKARIEKARDALLRFAGMGLGGAFSESEETFVASEETSLYDAEILDEDLLDETVVEESEDSGKEHEWAAERKLKMPQYMSGRRLPRVGIADLFYRSTAGADATTEDKVKEWFEAGRPVLEDKSIKTSERFIAEDIGISDKLVSEHIEIREQDVSGRTLYHWGDGLDGKPGITDHERMPGIGRSGGAILGLHQPNDDACFADPDSSSFGVFDGVGGRPGSHAASRLASNHFRTGLKDLPDDLSKEQMRDKMQELYEGARQEIRSQYPGTEISTTGSVFKTVFHNGKRFGVALNVGDSRITCLSAGAEKLRHITNDAGKDNEKYWDIQQRIAELEDFEHVDPDLKSHVDQRHILQRSLNGDGSDERVKSDVYIFEIKPGDKIIITSDGIHDNLIDARMIDCVKDKDAAEAARDLVWQAEIKSHEKDEYRQALARSRSNDELIRSHAQVDVQRLEKMQYSRAKPDDMTALVIQF